MKFKEENTRHPRLAHKTLSKIHLNIKWPVSVGKLKRPFGPSIKTTKSLGNPVQGLSKFSHEAPYNRIFRQELTLYDVPDIFHQTRDVALISRWKALPYRPGDTTRNFMASVKRRYVRERKETGWKKRAKGGTIRVSTMKKKKKQKEIVRRTVSGRVYARFRVNLVVLIPFLPGIRALRPLRVNENRVGG